MENDYVNDFDKTFLELTKVKEKFGESKLETYVQGIMGCHDDQLSDERSRYRISLLEGALKVMQKKSTRAEEANSIFLMYSSKKKNYSNVPKFKGFGPWDESAKKMCAGILGASVLIGSMIYIGPLIKRGINEFGEIFRFSRQLIKNRPIESYNAAKKNNYSLASTKAVEVVNATSEKELDQIVKQITSRTTDQVKINTASRDMDATTRKSYDDQYCQYAEKMVNGETLEQFADRHFDLCNFPKKDKQLLEEYVVEIARCNVNADGSLGKLRGPMAIRFPCTEIEYLEDEQKGQ